MNDEIKEILDDLLFTTTLPNVSVKLSEEKLNQLKDYITNLQQENEELKKKLDRRYYKNEYERIKQENERLKVNCNLGYEELKTARNYKSRCEKASDKLSFIDEALENDTLNVPLCIAKINSALNILQNEGDNNE